MNLWNGSLFDYLVLGAQLRSLNDGSSFLIGRFPPVSPSLFLSFFMCVPPSGAPPPVFCAVNSPVIDVAAAVIHPVIGWQIKLMVDGTKKDEHPANPFDKFTWIVLAKNED